MEQTFGKYQLVKKLATGGMAEVWLAVQTGIEGFNRHVVIKRILPHLSEDPEFVQMFLNEAKIASRFNHPNIAQIYDLGEASGTYFIAMEYVHGEDLGRVMRRAWSSEQWVAGPLAIRIVADACGALHYAHTRTDEQGRPLKVVHRDISPQNILVSFDGSVKVVDFGIAKAADQVSQTKSGAIKGKFAYMPPEQAAGKVLDGRTDVFALGLVLYELITGVRPLKRDSELGTLQAAMECAIEPPSMVAEVAPELDEVVMGALAKRPDDRYGDARQFQMALEQFLVGQGTVATSVQLSELMEQLFADRLAEERRLGAPAPATESSASNSAASPGPPPRTAERATDPGGPSRRGPGATLDEEPEEPEPEEVDEDDFPEASAGAFALPVKEKVTPPPPSRKPSKPVSKPAVDKLRSVKQIRRVSAQIEPDTKEDPVPPRAKRKSTSGIAKRPPTSEEMPEAPARASKLSTPAVVEPKPAQPVESNDGLSRYVDVQKLKASSASQLKRLVMVVAFALTLVLVLLFREPLFSRLGATGLSGAQVPVMLTVTSNPRTKVTIVPGAKAKSKEPVELGETPLNGVSGAFVGDTVVLSNVDRGIRYEESIGAHPANEPVLVEKVFREATLKVRTKPVLKDATVWLNNQQIGKVGVPMKVFEGTQRFEIRGESLKTPVPFDAKLEGGEIRSVEIEVAAAVDRGP